jgi:hypothetical protein
MPGTLSHPSYVIMAGWLISLGDNFTFTCYLLSLSGLNILLNALLSKTLSLCYPLRMKDKVSRWFKAKDKITVTICFKVFPPWLQERGSVSCVEILIDQPVHVFLISQNPNQLCCQASVSVTQLKHHRLQYVTPSPIPINSQFIIITRLAGNNALLKNNQASGWGAANEWASVQWV